MEIGCSGSQCPQTVYQQPTTSGWSSARQTSDPTAAKVDSGFIGILVIGVIIATTLAILFGVLLNLVIPQPSLTAAVENIYLTLFYLYVQLIVIAVIVVLAAYFFARLLGRHLYTYLALNIFVIILFLTQQQIFIRLLLVVRTIFGIDLTRRPQ